jgi:two-component system sensor histidine kinase BaeS
LKSLLTVLRGPLRLQDEAVVAVAPGGRLFDVGRPMQAVLLPSGLGVSDLKPASLLAGQTTSGIKGSIVWAAAPYRADIQVGPTPATSVLMHNLTQAVILTRRPPTGLRAAGPWFVIAAAATLLAAAIVAMRLGRRMTRPLVEAETVTRRIAAGDLTAQVPVPPRADPETASLAHSINTMASTLARSRGLERQFLMSVSHDLRTPMTSIRGYAEAIADGTASDPARAAGVIMSESRRLERLVGDLLDLAKLDARRFVLDVRRVDLAEVVVDTGERFQPAAAGFGLSLTVDAGPAGGIAVMADPDRLAQVVANLVENALKYATANVQVATALSDGMPVLWVTDDGPGIAPSDLPRVFERLFMSSRSPGRQVGSGLGLAIVAELVAAMGGAVRAESPVPGRDTGTRVVVTLPLSWSESDVREPTSLSPVSS